MNSHQLNRWLTLAANLGVLIGIAVIVVELQQTQTAMLADSSTARAQMISENVSISADNGINEIQVKLAAGEKLTEEELRGGREFVGRMLRYFENLHYLNRIGVLDKEIWESNTRGMRGLRRTPIFIELYPSWPESEVALRYSVSFVEYMER